MNVAEAKPIITFDCQSAQFIFTAVFRGRKEIICPGCGQVVEPCNLGALFNGEAYHKALPCLLSISDYLTGQHVAHVETNSREVGKL